MDINSLKISDIKIICKRLEWTEEFKKDGWKWLALARKIRGEYNLTDKDILDIVNHRLKL